MTPTPELVDELFRAKIEAARRRPPRDKFLDGARLRAVVRNRNMTGIRNQFPLADEQEVVRIYRERLAVIEKLEGAQL